jgi:hypothetical protein
MQLDKFMGSRRRVGINHFYLDLEAKIGVPAEAAIQFTVGWRMVCIKASGGGGEGCR